MIEDNYLYILFKQFKYRTICPELSLEERSMKKKIRRLSASKFLKNITIMVSGTLGAPVITLVLSPVIARLYGPEAFGIMGTFNSIINIIVPIAALTYPIAIVLPKNDLEAKLLVRLSLYIAVSISLLTFVILLAFNQVIIDTFNLNDLSNYLFLLPIAILFSAFMQVSEQWLIRTKQFTVNARVLLLQSLMINGSKVSIGFFYPFASVLVFFTVLSNGLKAFMLLIYSEKSKCMFEKNKKKNQIKEYKKIAKKYYDFPVYRAPEVFINSISNSLPVLILSSFFGVASAGFYTIGRTVLSIPTRIIGKAVGDVFYPHITEVANKGKDVSRIIIKATCAMAGIGIVPFGLIILFGPKIFSLVFGNEWVIAGEYARWIALWSYFAFINRPSVHALPVLKAQKFHLIYTIIMLISRVIALTYGYLIYSDDLISVALFSITGSILNLGLILITIKISKKSIYS